MCGGANAIKFFFVSFVARCLVDTKDIVHREWKSASTTSEVIVISMVPFTTPSISNKCDHKNPIKPVRRKECGKMHFYHSGYRKSVAMENIGKWRLREWDRYVCTLSKFKSYDRKAHRTHTLDEKSK